MMDEAHVSPVDDHAAEATAGFLPSAADAPPVALSAPVRDPGQAAAAAARRLAPSMTYAALDLGTNNCRLLVARPASEGFRVVDAFSRIVRWAKGWADRIGCATPRSIAPSRR